jgi:hypothetical protein
MPARGPEQRLGGDSLVAAELVTSHRDGRRPRRAVTFGPGYSMSWCTEGLRLLAGPRYGTVALAPQSTVTDHGE